jgi:hypothetical protein
MKMLRTLDLHLRNDDMTWWTIIPNPMINSSDFSSSLPLGLHNLTSLYMDGLRQGADWVYTALALRFMLLPQLKMLELKFVTDPDPNDEGPLPPDKEDEEWSTFYGTSTVSDVRLVDCSLSFSNIMHFVKLPKVLEAASLTLRSDAALSVLSDHLRLHKDTLQKLHLFTQDIDPLPETTSLGSLRMFSVLREFEGDIDDLLLVDQRSTSLATVFPLSLEVFQISLGSLFDEEMDAAQCKWQMLEIVQKCRYLTSLFVIGPEESIIQVFEAIEDLCFKRDIKLQVEGW